MPKVFLYLGFLIFLGVSELHAAKIDIDYDAGVKAFEAGDFELARTHFERAKHNGLKRAGLHLKLGVSYFNLGHYEQAMDEFNLIVQHKASMNKKVIGAAYYNLGLTARKLNDETAARQWFEAAYNNNDEKTRDLAQKQLMEPDVQDPELRWSVLTISARYDDNLVDPFLETGGSEGDSFGEIFFASGGPISIKAADELQYDVNVYLNSHSHLDIYNYNLLHLGLIQPFNAGKWVSNAGLQFEFSTFGGHSYQRSYIFDISTKYKAGKKIHYGVQYIHRMMDSMNSDYDYLQGTQQQLIGDVQWRNFGKTRVRYTYETNDLDDLMNGLVFTSFSPKRNSIDLLHEQPVTKGLIMNTGLGYRQSRYPDANIFIDGSSITRSDDRIMLSMSLMMQLSSNWHFNLEYQYTDNDSNITDYSYTSNLYGLGVLGVF